MSDKSDSPLYLRADVDGVATLTLNRGPQRNALSRDLMIGLKAELDAIHADESVRVVVIAADGPAFCAGHDLKEIRANADEHFYADLFRLCSDMMMRIVTLRQPVIARVHGIATAAGCQLVATCDLAVAEDGTRFATPGVNIGLFCSTPMVALSRNVGRKKTMEMLLTGDMIGAEEAVAIGLINKAVPADRLDAEVAELARKIVAKSPLTLAIGKEAFYRQLDMGLVDAYAYAAEVMTRNMMTGDAQEGVDAFIEKRHPVWKGV
ncbi:MAG: enoyl-CoA hydratase [Rhodospirillales bacterium]